MVKSHGDFVLIVDLPEGDHQYKFCVDGEWRHDSKLKNIDNDVGTKNNLVTVRQSDFEVFQALAKDSEDSVNNAQKEYSQDIPTDKPFFSTNPPVLPPHLLQVILNKDTPLSVSQLYANITFAKYCQIAKKIAAHKMFIIITFRRNVYVLIFVICIVSV